VAVTSAVSTLGKISGAPRQLSSAQHQRVAGQVEQLLRGEHAGAASGAAIQRASRVPSASVNDTSWLRVSCCPTRLASISPSE
jgi:hypothetical protein